MLKKKEFIRAQSDEAVLQNMTSPSQLPDSSPPGKEISSRNLIQPHNSSLSHHEQIQGQYNHDSLDQSEEVSLSHHDKVVGNQRKCDQAGMSPPYINPLILHQESTFGKWALSASMVSSPSSSASRPPSAPRPSSAQSLPEPTFALDLSPPRRSKSSTPVSGDINKKRLTGSNEMVTSPFEGTKLTLPLQADILGFMNGNQFLAAEYMYQQNAPIYNGVPLFQVPPFMQQQNNTFSMQRDQQEINRSLKRSKKSKAKPLNNQIGLKCTKTAENGKIPPAFTALPQFPSVKKRKAPETATSGAYNSSLQFETSGDKYPNYPTCTVAGVQRPIHDKVASGNTVKSTEVSSMTESIVDRNDLGVEQERLCFERAGQPLQIQDEMGATEEVEEEEIARVCDWCFYLKSVTVSYKNIETVGEQRKYYFCSQKCFDSFRRVMYNYKKTKVCSWCGEGGSENELYQVGEEFTHFCSEMHHKLELLRRDGMLQVFRRPVDDNATMKNSSCPQEDTLSSLVNTHCGTKEGRRPFIPLDRKIDIPKNVDKFNAYMKQLQQENSNCKDFPAHSKTHEEKKISMNNVQIQQVDQISERATKRSFVKVKPDHVLKESSEVKRSKCIKASRSVSDQKKKEHNSRRNKMQSASSTKPTTINPSNHKRILLHGQPQSGPKLGMTGLPPHVKHSGGHIPIGPPLQGLQNVHPHILMSLGLGLPPPLEHLKKGTNYLLPFSQTTVTHTIPFFVPLPIPVPYPVPIKCEQEACIKEENEKKRAEEEEWKIYIQMAEDEEKVEREKKENKEKMKEEHVVIKKKVIKEEVTKMEQKKNTNEVDEEWYKYKRMAEEPSDIKDNLLVIDEELQRTTKKPTISKEKTAIKLKIFNRKTVINASPKQNKADNKSIDTMNTDNIARIHRRAKLFDRTTEKI